MIDPLGLFGGHVAETRAGGFHAIRCTIPELTQRGQSDPWDKEIQRLLKLNVQNERTMI